jgi:hypothetical protein
MNLKQKLLTLDIIVLLVIAAISLAVNDLGYKDVLVKYFIPIMLTAYLVGRHIPLQIVKKHLKNQK